MRRLARIETSRTIRSGFTRCLHCLAATVEHVRCSAWSLPFPVTLENVYVQRALARSVLGSMARDAAPFAGRKCRVYKVSLTEASNGTTILAVVLPRGVSLAHFAFILTVASSLLSLSIHHLPLARQSSSFFNPSSFHRFLSFILVCLLLVYEQRFS